MILIPILTLTWLAVSVRTIYSDTGESSYDLWLNEPNDLELVE